MKRTFYMLMLAAAGLMLTGCNPGDMVDSQVEAKAREYFPYAEVSHPRRDVLQITTHVGNISEKFAAQVMAQLIRDNRRDLEMGLPLGGFAFLTVAFDGGNCLWSPQRAGVFACSGNPPAGGLAPTSPRIYPVYGR